jgi:hypothetical protein
MQQKIKDSQHEAYVCYLANNQRIDDMTSSDAHIALPLCIDKNEKLEERPAWELEHLVDVPAFGFERHIFEDIRNVFLGGQGQYFYLGPGFTISAFEFFARDEKDQHRGIKVTRCLQFIYS